MTAGRWGRLLDRLTEIEAEIEALHRELDAIDAKIGEAEQHARLVSAIAEALSEP